MDTITIRQEQEGDAPAIREIVRRAYADVAYSDHREHVMIDRLRESEAYVPALSFLAEVGGDPAGHILLTIAHIGTVPILALAPLSVVPEWQGQGVGAQLVGAAHRQAAALGFGSIVLVGLPAYYPRFGYEPLQRYPITLPFDAPADNCMILRLYDGALEGIAGQVAYAPAWLDH